MARSGSTMYGHTIPAPINGVNKIASVIFQHREKVTQLHLSTMSCIFLGAEQKKALI